MPYIADKKRREKLRNGEPALLAGELNYQIFYYIKHTEKIDKNIVIDFIEQFLGDKPSYQKYNDVTGVMIRCYKEIKRRLNKDVKDLFIKIMESYDEEIDKYEDRKRIENGDVE